ncbi:MAG: class I SAM-dependent rRNA methyltransferase [bacterium]
MSRIALRDEPRLIITGAHVKTPRIRPVWIFDNMVAETRGAVASGQTVYVYDRRNKFLGSAIYNERSKIRARIFSLDRELFDNRYIARAMESAVERRRAFYTPDDSFRAVYSDSDFLPGVVVDKLGDVVVVELLTLAAHLRRTSVLAAVEKLLRPPGIVLRVDDAAREKEGLDGNEPLTTGVIPPVLRVRTDGFVLFADPIHGQKSGLFLDQRFNRRLIAPWCGQGRVLDLFCHTGGWAFTAALAGAADVTAVDSSGEALELGRAAAAENGFAQVRFEQSDVFDFLAAVGSRGAQYDVIVSDPPAFAKSRKHVPEAVRAYLSLNYRAMKLLKSGGVLAACSCSHHVTREEFDRVLGTAARNARMNFHIIARGAQAPDHPILLGLPESDYLKCVLLRRVS